MPLYDPYAFNRAKGLTQLPRGVVKHDLSGCVPNPQRDEQIKAFEEYLLRNLKGGDVIKDTDGIYFFNINQVAYIVEGCTTPDQQMSLKNRLTHAIHAVTRITKRLPPDNIGMSTISSMHFSIRFFNCGKTRLTLV